MATKNQDDKYEYKVLAGKLPETPPAHIWALKAIRNQLLGTRPSPLVTADIPDDEIDEVAKSYAGF